MTRYCTKCGKLLDGRTNFCGHCGAPLGVISESVTAVVERDAKIRLKRAHDKLVATQAVMGGVCTIVSTVILLVIADHLGAWGGAFVLVAALLSSAAFIMLFIPHYMEASSRLLPTGPEDPLTGVPMRMLWWWRWFAGALAFFMFVGLGDYPQKSAREPQNAATQESSRSVPVLTAKQLEQQSLDARLALCVATDHEYQTVLEGKPHKDAIILANQFSVGERAGGRAIGREWFAYKDGEWHDSQCTELSIAPWTNAEGYIGDPIHLPDGAIAVVVNSGGWSPPDSDLPHNSEGTIGDPEEK
jgi:hypothetical protein